MRQIGGPINVEPINQLGSVTGTGSLVRQCEQGRVSLIRCAASGHEWSLASASKAQIVLGHCDSLTWPLIASLATKPARCDQHCNGQRNGTLDL